MKQIILIITFLSISFFTSAYAGQISNEKLNTIINAMIQVESNGNNKAIGDNGNAIGCLQIWKITVDDVNRILKLQKSNKRFTYQDRFNRLKSIDMCKIYLKFYGKYYERKTNHTPTTFTYSSFWNGGGAYWKTISNKQKKLTRLLQYWRKVIIELRK